MPEEIPAALPADKASEPGSKGPTGSDDVDPTEGNPVNAPEGVNVSRIPSIWRGYIGGTNRADIVASIAKCRAGIRAKCVLDDHSEGPAYAVLEGGIDGLTATLRIVRFKGLSPIRPLDGMFTLQFQADGQETVGQWKTDVASKGYCVLRRLPWWKSLWLLPLGLNRFRRFWFRYAPTMYVLLLLGTALTTIFGFGKASYPALILLLIPAPLLFQQRLRELLVTLRIKKAGPIEFGSEQPPIGSVGGMVSEIVDERLRFSALDLAFVPMTELVLLWLSEKQPAPPASFFEFTASIGVFDKNRDATLRAIVSTGCVYFDQESRLNLSGLGNKYVAYIRTRLQTESLSPPVEPREEPEEGTPGQ